jgi:hypothetical protein
MPVLAFCDIARLRMDFRFRWKTGRAVDIVRPDLSSDMRVVFFGNTPDESQLGLIVAMLHRY